MKVCLSSVCVYDTSAVRSSHLFDSTGNPKTSQELLNKQDKLIS